ncbi:MAG: stage II sporulation protein R [Firmicutes bacterium]|nr:stage II sporulation protein R [Bacillota bacterium]
MSAFFHWLVALVSSWTLWYQAPPPPPAPSLSPGQVIRFRVIANSDSAYDQAVKLKVRDAELRFLEPRLVGLPSRQATWAELEREQKQLGTIADKVLEQNGAPYSAAVHLTTTSFPTKSYGTLILPAGRYQALLIVLGRGAGHNWWCVLYPSLCFVDLNNGLAVPASQAAAAPVHLKVRWGIGNFLRLLSSVL